jgi:hypothetical protein
MGIDFMVELVALDAETRSLTRTDCASDAFPNCDGETEEGDDDGFAGVVIGFAAETAAAAAAAGPSTFFNVSSTSASGHPAPTSAALMVARATPSFIWEEIYSTSWSCTIILFYTIALLE